MFGTDKHLAEKLKILVLTLWRQIFYFLLHCIYLKTVVSLPIQIINTNYKYPPQILGSYVY